MSFDRSDPTNPGSEPASGSTGTPGPSAPRLTPGEPRPFGSAPAAPWRIEATVPEPAPAPAPAPEPAPAPAPESEAPDAAAPASDAAKQAKEKEKGKDAKPKAKAGGGKKKGSKPKADKAKAPKVDKPKGVMSAASVGAVTDGGRGDDGIGAAAGDTARPSRPNGTLLAIIGVLAVVLVVVGILAIVQASRAGDLASKRDSLASERDSRKSAERAAGEFTVALSTLDSTDPNATLKRVEQFVTSRYRAELDKGNGPSGNPAPAPSSAKVTLTSSVKDTYLTELDGNKATAICEVTSSLTSGGQTVEVPRPSYFRISLVREGGTWRVDDASILQTSVAGTSGTSGAAAPQGTSGAS